jgi:EKC/KEOPS complex subunit PCC1/LAGE3
LAETTLKSLAVDEELSPLVRRSFSLVNTRGEDAGNDEENTVLRTEYKATTNRMLRVAVNGFFESLNVVVQVMEELDVDVLHENGLEDLQGVQGVEQGMIGTTVGGT